MSNYKPKEWGGRHYKCKAKLSFTNLIIHAFRIEIFHTAIQRMYIKQDQKSITRWDISKPDIA